MKLLYKKNSFLIMNLSLLIAFSADAADLQTTGLFADNQYSTVIELIVAGIVAAALIIAVLVLFLGRWAGRAENKKIKKIRIEAEKAQLGIATAVDDIRKKKEVTTTLVKDVEDRTAEFLLKQRVIDKQSDSIIESAKRIKAQEEALIHTTNSISLRMNKIQAYWDTQLRDTTSTIQEVQTNLNKTIQLMGQDLGSMQEQKQLSQDLLQDFLVKHREQSELISKNSNISEEVGKSLEETLEESTHLIDLLKQHQTSAEKSLTKFTEELTNFEEQAYEQFDSSFQVADLARQELTASIDESHVHIENMRRHEEQSRQINTQTRKNLEALDYSKIMKISNTLDSTQDLFTDIRDRVENTKRLLDDLKNIEINVSEATQPADDIEQEEMESDDALETNANVYKMASGDNTPLSFFSKIKKK